MTWDVLTGDCRDLLAQLPASSVHTVVTSPPYFGLRDYGTGEWEGGDKACDHVDEQATEARNRTAPAQSGGMGNKTPERQQAATERTALRYADVCGRCGATRKDKQLGLEPTPQDFVDALVQVFREVRRVLRDDGTVWLNLGDSYASSGVAGPLGKPTLERHGGNGANPKHAAHHFGRAPTPTDCKPKDLIGIPWMVAFALRDDGWYLRADIIWNKPNPMPESVTDRPTRSHEFIFLLTKNSRYHYDADGIRENDGGRASGNGFVHEHRMTYQNADGTPRGVEEQWEPGGGRNKRDVWTVSTKPFSEAHFATFPPDLIEPCVLAGCPERACSACGAPWERIVEHVPHEPAPLRPKDVRTNLGASQSSTLGMSNSHDGTVRNGQRHTLGFEPSCTCNADPAPGTVLDPFAGAGTTGLVAVRNRRSFVGLELNPEYAQMARDRIATDIRLGHRPPQRVDVSADQIDIFEALS